MFSSLFDWGFSNSWFNVVSSTDWHYDRETNILSLSLPGIGKDNIKIEVDHQKLYVFVKNKASEGQRVFYLSELIDKENITSSYIDGMLKIKLPLCKEKTKRAVTIT